MYTERPSRLAGAVVWSRPEPATGTVRVLPDGCMDLLWYDGRLIVAGPDTAAYEFDDRGATGYVGLRFAPGTAPALLGVPASELRDGRVPLDAVRPAAEVRELSDRMAHADDPAAALESVATRLGRLAPDPLVGAVASQAGTGSAVADIADAVNLSERQLHRRCLAAFGYGAKTLGRILRLNQALDLARAGTPYARVAAVAGYADQAHLARDVRALTGVPLTTLLP